MGPSITDRLPVTSFWRRGGSWPWLEGESPRGCLGVSVGDKGLLGTDLAGAEPHGCVRRKAVFSVSSAVSGVRMNRHKQ